MLKGSSIFWININNLDLLLFGFSTFSNYTKKKKKKKKKKKNLGCNEIFLKKIEKKGGQKKQIHRDEVKKKKKRICGVSFVDWRSFKTNKRIIIFCKKLVSRSRNLNQRKSRSILEARKHFNVEVEIYYFCQFTILTQFLSFR